MEYTCEDTNIALQRRLHDDMDTCAFTHFGLLETTGVVQPPAPPVARARATQGPPAAPAAMDTQKMMWVGVLVALVVAAIVYGRTKKK